MNPIFAWIIAETAARTAAEMLTRRCPECRHKQAVPEKKLKEPVACQRCRAPVPPEKPARR